MRHGCALKRPSHGRDLTGSDLGRRLAAVPLDDPGLIVRFREGLRRQAQLLDGGEVADPHSHTLLDRLERLEAIAAAAGMHPNAFGRAVIDGHEHRGLAFATRSVMIVPS
jgi:hypothetical protein